MKIINYGEAVPEDVFALQDKHGDVWFWNDMANVWETYETAAFKWADMKRSWFPMRTLS